MKKLNFMKMAMLFVSALAITSCSSDDDDGGANGTSTGNYWPMAVNNTWDMDADGVTQQVKLTGTANFGGTTYYELEDEGTTGTFDIQTWIGKIGATYFQKVGDFSTVENGVSITMEGYEVPMFRDDLEVGETWSGTLSPEVTYSFNGQSGSLPATVNYTGTILARDVTETINGVTYDNIIKISLEIQSSINGQNNTVESEYWFAKDVGPVRENQSVDGGAAIERTLLDYNLN